MRHAARSLATLGVLSLTLACDAPAPSAPPSALPPEPSLGLTTTTSSLTVSELIDLGTLGGTESFATAINARGHVVGGSQTEDFFEHAFIWTSGEGMVDLGTFGGFSSVAVDINDAGVIVGEASFPDFSVHAFLRRPGQKLTDLGDLGGGSSSAFAINAAGHVVGSSRTDQFNDEAFLWTPQAGMVPLGTLAPGNFSLAFDINDHGVIVGSAGVAGGTTHAFIYRPGSGISDLGTLPGGTFSSASGINNDGSVVGTSTDSTGRQRAVIWRPGQSPVDLGGLPGGRTNDARAINAHGVIVGSSESEKKVLHTAIWQQAGVTDLHPARNDVRTTFGQDINNANQVAGILVTPAGGHAALWKLRNVNNGAPLIDDLVVTARTDGILLRFRLDDAGDSAPWKVVIDWGDGVIDSAAAQNRGPFSFLRKQAFAAPGTYKVIATVVDRRGLVGPSHTVLFTVP